MKQLLLALACWFLVLQSSAQTFPIGHTTIVFNDPARSGGTGSGGGPGRQIQTEIYYPATAAGDNTPVANGQFPVIVFGHGFVMTYDVYKPIYDSLAANGYVVALSVTEGSLSPSHTDFAKDLAIILDKMLLLNTSGTSAFNNKLNGRGAIGGHSMGGGCTFLANQYTNNANCYFTFAAANTNPSAIAMANSITKPHLLLAGDHDCVAPPNDHQIPLYNALNSSCKTLVNIEDAMHCQFNNNSTTCSFGESSLFCFQLTLNRNEQLAIVRQYLYAYLGYYLKGNCANWGNLQSLVTASAGVNITQSCNNNVPANAAIVGNSSLCATDSVALYASPAGFTYNWSNGATSDSINVLSQDTFSLTVTNGVCSISSAQFIVTENTPPSSPGAITGDGQVCAGSNVTYSVGNIAGLNYQWVTPQGWAIVAGDSTTAITLSPGALSGTLYAAAGNQCGWSSFDSIQVEVVTTTPVLSTLITGIDTICINDTTEQVYGTQPVGSASYNWVIPVQWTVISGIGTDILTVTPNATGGLVTLYAANACGNSDTALLNVVIADTIIPAITQSGDTLSTGGASSYQWWFNGSPIQGATSSTIVPQAEGNYSVVVTNDNGCSSISSPFQFQFNSLNTVNAMSFALYPNPAAATVLVSGLQGPNTIHVTDISGRIISSTAINGSTTEVNLNGMQSGVYFVKVHNSYGQTAIKRLLKQ